MGAIAAIVGAGCCCGGTFDPCDCELTSIQVTWTGSFACGWSCAECEFGEPNPFHDNYGEGEVVASEVTATLTKPSPTSCAFVGSAVVIGDPLVNCYSGVAVNFALQLTFTFHAVWVGTRWRVYVKIQWFMRRLSDGALYTFGAATGWVGNWCYSTPGTFEKWLAFEAGSSTQCPDEPSYSEVPDTPLCSAWTSPTGTVCSGPALAFFFPLASAPGLTAFDYGSVSVS